MATVFDAAAYILDKLGSTSAMKLQKLVYYSQAWSLVWDGEPLFDSRIEAWIDGPVVRELYECHRGQFKVDRATVTKGDATRLTADQIETIDAVLETYGDKSPQWLSDLTHRENPWKVARSGLKPSERGNSEISHASMAEYYGALYGQSQGEAAR